MEFLKLLVGAAVTMIVAGIAFHVLAGILLAIFGLRRHSKVMVIAGTALALLPFATFLWSGRHASSSYKERMKEIAAMERHALPANYPRTAVVLGHSTPIALNVYMVLGYLDEVRSDANGPRGSAYRPRPAPGCHAEAYAWLQKNLNGNLAYSSRWDKLSQCWEEVGADVRDADLPANAIIIRRDSEALNRAPGNTVWSGGIVEISLRSNGQETLIDYAEKPHIEKSMSPFLPLPESMDTGPSPDPDRMIARMFGPVDPVSVPRD